MIEDRLISADSSRTEESHDRAIRPLSLQDYIGQTEVKQQMEIFIHAARGRGEPLDHTLVFGPPGLGKTTLANIIANELNANIKATSGPVLEKAGDLAAMLTNLEAGDVLFIDEIHRFSKSQQDSLLGAVETGIVTLIGATTENPSFEVIPALLSRCQVYTLEHFSKEDLQNLLQRAVSEDEKLAHKDITIREDKALLRLSGGDARKLLNVFELIVNSQSSLKIVIDDELVNKHAQQVLTSYDKGGEQHYDIASALIKSIRGSDPNAAVYWLARMIDGGEDAKFIARRLLISAS